MTKVVVLRKALKRTYPGSRDGAFIGRSQARRLAKFLGKIPGVFGRCRGKRGLKRFRAVVLAGCDGPMRRLCAIGGIVSRGSDILGSACGLMARRFRVRPLRLADARYRCGGATNNPNGQPCCPDAYDCFVRVMVFRYHDSNSVKMLGYYGPENGFPAAVRKVHRDKLIDFG